MGRNRKWWICIHEATTKKIMRLYCVFGDPILHSKSPLLHNYVFYKLKIDARYIRFNLKNKEDFKNTFFDLNLEGANITLPLKEELFGICDEIRGEALNIKSINTIIKEKNKLIGLNTDSIGFYKSIENYNIKNAILIGAGGSSKAIAIALKQNKISTIIINRSQKNIDFFTKNGFRFHYENLESLKKERFDLVVNSTSASIKNELPLKENILIDLFKNAKIAYEIMYGLDSRFIQIAKKSNVKTIDGRSMLINQAIESSSLFLNLPSNKIAPHMQKIAHLI